MTKRRTHGEDHGSRLTRERHVPVLTEEIVAALARPDGQFIDTTVGDGGHADALLQRSGQAARLLGLDLDPESIRRAEATLASYGSRVRLMHASYTRLRDVAQEAGFSEPTGILFDLGMATHHLAVERGFSFHNQGTLDMRFDPTGAVELPAPELASLQGLRRMHPAYTAADILMTFRADQIAEILERYGDERHAQRIADAIVSERRTTQVTTAPDLVRVVVHALPPAVRHRKMHAATKTFQALRIAVNREWESIRLGVTAALQLLPSSGRLAVITFHSGEDRLVKSLLRDAVDTGSFRHITRHAVRPAWKERQKNPWSRSALLRIVERP